MTITFEDFKKESRTFCSKKLSSKKKPLNKSGLAKNMARAAKHEMSGFVAGSAIAAFGATKYIFQKIRPESQEQTANALHILGKEIAMDPHVCAGLVIAGAAIDTYLVYRIAKRHWDRAHPKP